jgi:D-xylose transport system substrate-binding protein
MKKLSLLVAGIAAGSMLLTACSSSDDSSSSSSAAVKGKVGVILPDTKSSSRWENNDRPLLADAFKAAGVEYDIQNAQGDKTQFLTICDQQLNAGAKVLLIVNLDSDTGAACIKKATDQGVPVIDYDRLTLNGGAKYYVSFDNVKVGAGIGGGLVKCLKDNNVTSGPVALLNGSPTDNNATLFKQGYEKAVKEAGFTVVADQSVPNWDNTQAGTIFEQMFTQNQGKFVGVVSANDGLGGAVVSVLSRNGVAGKIPTTGQDATDPGLQRVLLGTQCNTVYKAIKKEADAASALAIAVLKGDTSKADSLIAGNSVTDTKSGKTVPSVLLEPQVIFASNVKDVVADGFTTAAKICTTPELQTACQKYGVS